MIVVVVMKVYKKSKYNILYINILLQGRVIILCTTCRAKTQKSLSDPFTKEYFFEGMYSSSSNADGEESEVGIDSNSSTSEDENAEMVLLSELSEDHDISSEEEEEENSQDEMLPSSSDKNKSNNTTSSCSTANIVVAVDNDSSRINKPAVGSKSKTTSSYVRKPRNFTNLKGLGPFELQSLARGKRTGLRK